MKKIVSLLLVVFCITLPALAQKKAEEKLLIPFRKGDKWGFSNEKKKIKIKPIFEDVTIFTSGRWYDSQSQNGTYTAKGWLNQKEVVIAEDGSYIAKENLNNDDDGDFQIADKALAMGDRDYENTCTEKPFPDASLSFANGKHGFKAKYNPKFIGYAEATYAPVYSEFIKALEDYKYAIVRLKENQKLGVIDTEGNIIVPFEADELSYSEARKYFLVNQNGKKGIIGLQGNSILPVAYQTIEEFGKKDIFLAMKDNKYGLVNAQNQTLIPFEYNSFITIHIKEETQEYFFKVSKDYKSGILDEKNNIILPIEYSQIKSIYNYDIKQKGYTLFSIFKENLEGIYDFNSGKIIVPCKYKAIGNFEPYKTTFLSRVSNQNNIEFYIDIKGTEYYEK